MNFTRHQHQTEAIELIKENIDNGIERFQVIFPTGGGKTLTQIDTIKYFLEKCDRPSVVVVLAPRIQLCLQHMEGHYLHRAYGDVKFIPMAVHSASIEVGSDYGTAKVKEMRDKTRASEDLSTEEINEELNRIKSAWSTSVVCTTSPVDIRSEYERAMALNKHLIIFSTYHSASRLNDSGIPLDIIIADEAHNLVTNEFTVLHECLHATVWAFFTATQRETASSLGMGMSNHTLFGPVIYRAAAKDLIDRGIMAEPVLHFMYANGLRLDGVRIANKKKMIDDGERASNYDAVKEIITKQTELTGFDPKILVACKDVDEAVFLAKSFSEDDEFIGWTIFDISAKGGANISQNGIKKPYNRGDFMKMLKNCSAKSIILHYDILSEGIDVDGISGVVLLREMGVGKYLQTIGRATRVLANERELPIIERTKRYAWISVPMVEQYGDNCEDYASLKSSVVELVSAMLLGGVFTDKVCVHKPRSRSEDTDIGADPIDDPKPEFGAFEDVPELQDITHEIMRRELDRMTGEVQLVTQELLARNVSDQDLIDDF